MKLQEHYKLAVSRGVAAVEFALILPILGILAFPVIDYSRAIQAKTILTNITREGAYQISRKSDINANAVQSIMEALNATTPPLQMQTNGMIYITQIIGGTNGSNKLYRQFRWANGLKDLNSAIANCTSYNDPTRDTSTNGVGSSSNANNTGGEEVFTDPSNVPDPPVINDSFENCYFIGRTTTAMEGALQPGQTGFAVESFYRQSAPLLNLSFFGVAPPPRDLYAVSFF